MQDAINAIQELCKKAYKGEVDLPEELFEYFGQYCKEALRKQFSSKDTSFRYRLSAMGRPIQQLQAEKLNLPKDAEEPYNTTLKFLYGDLLEGVVMTLLKAVGTNIEAEQQKVALKVEDREIPGTLDLVVDGKVWDVKSASPYAYESKFAQGASAVIQNDSYGYADQLSNYAMASNTDLGGWVAFNKVTGEICSAPIINNDDKTLLKYTALQRVKKNLITLEMTKTIDDISKIVPKVPEMVRNKPTGKYVLHSDFTYFPYKKVLWGDKVQFTKLSTATPKWYVFE